MLMTRTVKTNIGHTMLARTISCICGKRYKMNHFLRATLLRQYYISRKLANWYMYVAQRKLARNHKRTSREQQE